VAGVSGITDFWPCLVQVGVRPPMILLDARALPQGADRV